MCVGRGFLVEKQVFFMGNKFYCGRSFYLVKNEVSFGVKRRFFLLV